MTEEVEQNQSLGNCPHYNYVYTNEHHHCVHTARDDTEAYGQLKWVLAQERQYSAYLKDKVQKLEKEVVRFNQNASHPDIVGEKRPRREAELEAANKQLKLTVANLKENVQKLASEKEKMVQDYQRYVKQLSQMYNANLEKKENSCRKLQDRLQQLSQQLEQIHDLLPPNIALVPPLTLEDEETETLLEEKIQKPIINPTAECQISLNPRSLSNNHRSQFFSTHTVHFSPPKLRKAKYTAPSSTEKRTSDLQLGTLSCTSSSTEMDSISEHSLSPSKEPTLLIEYLKSTPSKYGHLPSPSISESSSNDIPCNCHVPTNLSPCVEYTPSAFTSVIRHTAHAIKPCLKAMTYSPKSAADNSFTLNNSYLSHCDVHRTTFREPQHACHPIVTFKDYAKAHNIKEAMENVSSDNPIYTAYYNTEKAHSIPIQTRDASKTCMACKHMDTPRFITEERIKTSWTSSEDNISMPDSPLPPNHYELAGRSSTDSGLAESLDVVSSAAENDDPNATEKVKDFVGEEDLRETSNDGHTSCRMNVPSPDTGNTGAPANVTPNSSTPHADRDFSCMVNVSNNHNLITDAARSDLKKLFVGKDMDEIDINLCGTTSFEASAYQRANEKFEGVLPVTNTQTMDAFVNDAHEYNRLHNNLNPDIIGNSASSPEHVNASHCIHGENLQNKVTLAEVSTKSSESEIANVACSLVIPEVHTLTAGEIGAECTEDMNGKSGKPEAHKAVAEGNKSVERPLSNALSYTISATMPRMRARIKNGRNSSTDSDASGDSPTAYRHNKVCDDKNMSDGAVQKTLEALGLGC